jgi:hypothetical protein
MKRFENFLNGVTRRFSVTEARQKLVNKKRERMRQIVSVLKHYSPGEIITEHNQFCNHIDDWWSRATDEQVVQAFDDMQKNVAEGLLEANGWMCIARKENGSKWTTDVSPGYSVIIEGNRFTIRNGNKVEVDAAPLSKLLQVLTDNKKSGAIPGSITNAPGSL